MPQQSGSGMDDGLRDDGPEEGQLSHESPTIKMTPEIGPEEEMEPNDAIMRSTLSNIKNQIPEDEYPNLSDKEQEEIESEAERAIEEYDALYDDLE